MHSYARTLVILFLLIAIVNIGKNLDYKLDNTFITMGVVYLALTGSNLSLSQGSYSLYGWMYGFSWCLGLEMFSNPRSLTINGNLMPEGYLQNPSNSANLLLFVDDNILRNCWSVFILLFIMFGLMVFVWIVTYFLTKKSEFECNRST